MTDFIINNGVLLKCVSDETCSLVIPNVVHEIAENVLCHLECSSIYSSSVAKILKNNFNDCPNLKRFISTCPVSISQQCRDNDIIYMILYMQNK